MRDYTKLINYFHKLIYGKEESQDNENKLNSNQASFVSSSFASGVGGYISSSESSSLASSKNSLQFNQTNILDKLKSHLTLGLSKSTPLSNSNSTALILCNELTPLRSPALSTASSLNTPSATDEHPPFFCANGSYLIKKKFNESNQHRKSRKGKKQNKTVCSNEIDIIRHTLKPVKWIYFPVFHSYLTAEIFLDNF